MYYYYACCIMKWTFPLPKSIITSCQLTQFVVGLTMVWGYYFTSCWWDHEVKRFGFWVNYAYVGIVLALFVNFYIQTYIKAPARKKKAAKKAKILAEEEALLAKVYGPEGGAAAPAPATEGATTESFVIEVTDEERAKAAEIKATRAKKAADEEFKKNPVYKIWYKGVCIDVGKDWIKRHPGGDKVFKIFDNRDATDVITAMHSEQAMRQVSYTCIF